MSSARPDQSRGPQWLVASGEAVEHDACRVLIVTPKKLAGPLLVTPQRRFQQFVMLVLHVTRCSGRATREPKAMEVGALSQCGGDPENGFAA
jgi:hypothetical protein